MPPRASGGSMGWTERCDTPWALTVPSSAAVALAARHLAPPRHRAAAASAPPERAWVPWCRRCRIGTSFPAKWTRPVASDAACHAHTRRPSDSKRRATFSCPTGFCCPARAHRTAPREAARDQVQRCGKHVHARAHLQARRTHLALAPAGACRPCSAKHCDGKHGAIAMISVRLERIEVSKYRLTTLRLTAHAHEHMVSAGGAGGVPSLQASVDQRHTSSVCQKNMRRKRPQGRASSRGCWASSARKPAKPWPSLRAQSLCLGGRPLHEGPDRR